jgi:hypothetical protein
MKPPKQKTYVVDPALGIVYGHHGKPIRKRNHYGYIVTQHPFAFAHRLIWESAYGPIPRGLTINHKNGVKTDNRIENLELATREANSSHAHRTGLVNKRGEANSAAVLTVEQVRIIVGSRGAVLQRELADRFGVAASTISMIQNGKLWRETLATLEADGCEG